MPRSLPASLRPIGAHAVVSGGLATGGLRYAAATRAEAVQVFVTNPRGWALTAGDAREDAALRDHVAATGLPVFVHAPYLINVGSPDPLIRERSAQSLGYSLRRARAVGARGVVVHTGSATDGDRAAGLRRAARCLLPLLDQASDDGPLLLLEPMAGQGQMLCGPMADLEPYLDALGWHPRAGVCLDTCHAFASGHDLAAPQGAARMLAELAAAVRDPGGRLMLIHANDSAGPCGSRRDRHASIGKGHIGRPAFRELLGHPLTAGVPLVVETPGGERGHAADIAALKGLRDAAARAAVDPVAPSPVAPGQRSGPSPGSSW